MMRGTATWISTGDNARYQIIKIYDGETKLVQHYELVEALPNEIRFITRSAEFTPCYDYYVKEFRA